MTPPAVITIAISSGSCASSLSSYSRKRREASSGLSDELAASALTAFGIENIDVEREMMNNRDVEESKEQYDSDDNIERRRCENDYNGTDFSTLVFQHRARDGVEDHRQRQQRAMDRRSFSTTCRRQRDQQRRSMRSSRRSSARPQPSARRTLTDDQLGSLFLSLNITETSNEFAQAVNDVEKDVEEVEEEEDEIDQGYETASSGGIGNHDVSSHTDDDFVNHVLGSLLNTDAPKQQQQQQLNQRATSIKKEGGGILKRVFKNRRFSWRKNAKKNSASNSSAQANLPTTAIEENRGGAANEGNELEEYVLGSLGV